MKVVKVGRRAKSFQQVYVGVSVCVCDEVRIGQSQAFGSDRLRLL